MDKSRRKALGGLIFALGLIVMLIGAMTDLGVRKKHLSSRRVCNNFRNKADAGDYCGA